MLLLFIPEYRTNKRKDPVGFFQIVLSSTGLWRCDSFYYIFQNHCLLTFGYQIFTLPSYCQIECSMIFESFVSYEYTGEQSNRIDFNWKVINLNILRARKSKSRNKAIKHKKPQRLWHDISTIKFIDHVATSKDIAFITYFILYSDFINTHVVLHLQNCSSTVAIEVYKSEL